MLTLTDTDLLKLHARLVLTPDKLAANPKMLEIRASKSHDDWVQFALRNSVKRCSCAALHFDDKPCTSELYDSFVHTCTAIWAFDLEDLFRAYEYFESQYDEDMDAGNDYHESEWIDARSLPPADVDGAVLIELARHILSLSKKLFVLPPLLGAPEDTQEPA